MNTKFLRARLQELGFTDGSFADACGVTETHMQRVLKGYEPSRTLLILMAERLKCRVSDINQAPKKSQAAAG